MKKKPDKNTSTEKAQATPAAPSKAIVADKATKPAETDGNKAEASANKNPPEEKEKAQKKPDTKAKKAGAKHAAASKTPRTKAPGKHRLIFVSLVFVIALAAAGLAGYDFWLLRLQAPINAQVINLQNSFEARIGQLEQQLRNTQSRLSAEAQARQSAEAEHQALKAALQSVNERLGRSTLAWRMAEVEYLLTVANDRLLLARDRQTAIAVLETADSRLKAIGDPALLKVRKKIAGELTALRAVPAVDIPGVVLKLTSLAEAVPQLPLLDKKRLAVATEKQQRPAVKDWKQIPSVVWQDIKSLVQVRRHQQPTEPLLPPQQAGFLYQNLQLKLEQAKLAALQHDTAVFAAVLREATQWLDSYFEPEATEVQAMKSALAELQGVELQPELPDVSGSLRELRQELRALMNARATAGTAQDTAAAKPAGKEAGAL
ncbi:MAG TPA: hypothetical protein ENI97_10155 [Gammaproteobacteria bacterium]|nr:hypothetical protein [Gammaproteobacteria bacterium]